MDLEALVKTILLGGILLIVVSIGVRARPQDTLQLIRNPKLGLRAMTAMFVAVPAFVLIVTKFLPLDQPVRVALLALAISPMPPIVSKKEIKVGGDANYAIGLQVLGTLFSILVVPFLIMLFAKVFGMTVSFDPFGMSKLLIMTVGAPLLAGIIFGRLVPAWREPVAVWAGRLGTAALIIGAAAVLFKTWPMIMVLIGSGALVVIITIILFALAVGHWLGGPDAGNRGALAIACAARHPGVALAISVGAFPGRQVELTGVVVVFLLANLAVTLPYAKWRQRATARG